MADIKSMFAKMGASEENGAGDAGPDVPPPKPPSKATIEKTYQKKSQLEHILLRPDTYIGSVEESTDTMWVYDQETESMVQKEIKYVPGLYKIFDEILVNAADNKQRDKKMDCIKVDINAEENIISIWNNGEGIPVVEHKDEKMFVPTMIFGHLLTSSNYNDNEEKVTGGRNGYGAKLCNIFSTKFVVETASSKYKKHFKQTWGSNMTKASDPKVKHMTGEDFTKITFSPDLAKFKMTKLDDDIVGLMSRRAFDVAASTKGVKVFLNGKRLPVKCFKDYIDLYIKGKEDDQGNSLKVCYEQCNDRWEVAVTTSDKGFQQVSFVNSIATTKGGKHVDYIADMVVKQLIDILKKKNKGGINIKPFQVRNHMWIFINCLIVNPTFDSQTKENMTLQVKSFGSKATLTDKFITQVTKSGIVENVLSWAKFKAQKQLDKTSGKKNSKLKGIPKLEDANEAGTKNALKCTLILTEGDSAKTLAVSGLGVVGRDYYGVFPLRGKLLNVREATHKQILENAEINNLIKILGLQYKKKYNNEEDMKTLRYGKLMIMTDQDQDGSHIKGLLINFIHTNWPELLRRDFLEEFITPIVKARKKNEELSFFSLPEFQEWQNQTPNSHTYQIKYYKGLGTSTAKEAKEYFQNMARHRIRFKYGGQEDDDHILLAFSKKHIEHRKAWLTDFMVESKRRKELGLSEKYLYTKDTRTVSYTQFVNLELILFSNADNVRSIPSAIDGFKPGQRKVLFTCFKRSDKKEVKVAQLAGSVAEHSAYHHGEVSLCMTIVGLAQNYVGSNNINVLEPRGQFGTRLTGGKDCASARYIFTKLSPITRMIFHPQDDPLLKHEYDDNQKIEPVHYVPILPMVLVNGADGIGTGWMTKIPNYNPRDIVKNLRLMMDGEDPKDLHPWYKNFRGTIEACGENRYAVSGEIALVGDNKLEISELPVNTWTQNYKENVLEIMVHGNEKVKPVLQDYKEYNTDVTVRFVVTPLPGQLEKFEAEGYHKAFKLQTLISNNTMCAFDELGCLRRFDSVMDILKEFYEVRVRYYQKRKDYLEGVLQAEAGKLSNQARFIMEKCSGKLTVENKKRKKIVEELLAAGYSPDPVKEWKAKQQENDEEQAEEEEEEDEEAENKKDFNKISDVQKFDYLLGMSMWMLTEEKKNELLNQRDKKLHELDVLKKKSKFDLWREDLDEFVRKLDELEEKERKDMEGSLVKKEKVTGLAARKKNAVLDTMPSPTGQRIAPCITSELKKKLQNYDKIRDKNKNVKVKLENGLVDDEFDDMIKSKKTLKEKLGTPEEVEKKKRGRKPAGDGMKQTKLAFPKKNAANGSPKKKGRKKKDSDDDDMDGIDDLSGSDVEFNTDTTPIKERTTSRRAATKVTKYNLDDSDDQASSEGELHDNAAVIEESFSKRQEKIEDSDSDQETAPPVRHETSEDMFDSLVGKKNDSGQERISDSHKRKHISSDSDSDFSPKKAEESEDEFDKLCKGKKEPAAKKAPKKEEKKVVKKKKKSGSGTEGSDEDSAKKKKKKAGKKKAKKGSDSDSDVIMESSIDEDFQPKKSSKPARAATKSKYAFSDSDE